MDYGIFMNNLKIFCEIFVDIWTKMPYNSDSTIILEERRFLEYVV